MLCVAGQGREWRGLKDWSGNWHTIYVRLDRSVKRGLLERILA